jgi:hypothetical protein
VAFAARERGPRYLAIMEKLFASSSGRMLVAGVAAAGVGVFGASQWSSESPPPPSGKSAAHIFAEIDTDKSGLVSATELKKALHKHGHPGSNAQVDQMMKLADKNDDGQLSLKEFKVAMEKMESRWGSASDALNRPEKKLH